MPSKLPWDRLKAALASLKDPGGFDAAADAAGGFDNLGTVVDQRRSTGKQFPSIAGVPDADLSKIDRFAHGANAYAQMPKGFRDTPFAPAAVLAGGALNEGLKMLPPNWGGTVQEAAGLDSSYQHDATTSKPSLANVANLLRGYSAGMKKNWTGGGS